MLTSNFSARGVLALLLACAALAGAAVPSRGAAASLPCSGTECLGPAPTIYDSPLYATSGAAIAPGQRACTSALGAFNYVAFGGRIDYSGLLLKSPILQVFRSPNLATPFTQVFSFALTTRDYGIAFDRNKPGSAGLFPGLFIFCVKNPKANLQTIFVTGQADGF